MADKGIPGYKNRLIVDHNEITKTLTDLEFNTTKDQHDDSVLDFDKQFTSGQVMRALTASGRWTGTRGEAAAVIRAAIGEENNYVVGGIGGLVWEMGTVIISAHDVDGANSSRIGVAGSWVFSEDDYFRGRQMIAAAFSTTNTITGAVVDTGARPTIATWSAGTHAAGSFVQHNGVVYRCLIARTASDTSNPATDTASWDRQGFYPGTSRARKIRVFVLDPTSTRPGGSIQLRDAAAEAGPFANAGTAQPFSASDLNTAITEGKPVELEVTTDLDRYVRATFTPTGAGTSGTVVIAAEIE
ncbi:MAG: hypothetical protein F4Y26_00485 [Gammaproteobacteria bacterium]|nr:hypothetical protein [Gammaproteobacteria bacterium]